MSHGIGPSAADIEAAANRAIGLQEAEKTTLKRLAAGKRIPDINGTNARIREITAAGTG